MKNSIYLFFAALVMIGLLPVFWTSSNEPREMEVYFFDVGQAESVFIRTAEGTNILIDGGYDNKVVERLGDVMEPWDHTIDLMILTHPHDDHVTGLVEVLRRFNVAKVISTGALHTAPYYLAWLNEVRDRAVPMLTIDKPRTLEIGNDARIEFIYPDRSFYGQSAENLNNTSIALKLIYGETAFFLGGDIEKEVEREILAKGIDLQCGVMKANHHGSDSSNTEEFIKAVGPQYCVISVGKNNSFGLPSRRVENRFLRENCRILRTDQLGTIKFSTDGKKLKFYE